MYKYEVFISYSSADRLWAEKLFRSLDQAGIDAWFDQERLKVGGFWESQVQDGIRMSRDILVVWTDNARQSDWVGRELLGLSHFTSAIDTPDPDHEPSDRRMIFLPLQGEPEAFDSLQMITDLRDAEVYPGSADDVDPDTWDRAVEKVYHAIRSDEDPAIPVPLLIMTMTKEQFCQLDPTRKPPRVNKTLEEYLHSIGIGSQNDLTPYYGLERRRWKPFGSRLSVWTMLRQISNEINKTLPDRDFRWELIGEDFWSDEDSKGFERGINKLRSTSPSVVIVDPIALYDEGIRDRFKDLSDALGRSTVTFITLLPLQCWGTHHHVREQMQRMARPLFRRLYEPTVGRDHPPDFWTCDVNIGDKMDMKRTLLPVLGRYLSVSQAEYLRNESGEA